MNCNSCKREAGEGNYCPYCGAELLRETTAVYGAEAGGSQGVSGAQSQPYGNGTAPTYAGRFQGAEQRGEQEAFQNGTAYEYNAEMNGNYVPVPPQPQSSMPTVSLVLGIISLIAWLLPLVGYPISIVGLVFGVKYRMLSGNARAGMVMSIIGLCLTVINSFLGILINLAL